MAEEQKKAGAPSQKKVAVKKGAPAQVTTEAVKKGEELTRFGKIKKWFREMKAELKKVVWPTKSTVVKNTTVALAVMAVAALTASAQNEEGQVTIMPKAGINISSITNSDGSKAKVGFVGGVEAEYGLPSNFSVSAGVLFSMQGAKAKEGDEKTTSAKNNYK